MFNKQTFFIGLCCLLCTACATTTQTVRNTGYTENTKAFSNLQEGVVRDKYAKYENAYDRFFYKITKYQNNPYQLVYHHPNDFTSDTYDYYIALVQFPSKASLDTITAVLASGEELPTAVQQRQLKKIVNYRSVNILLSQEQLIEAYETTKKLIIFLTANNQTYEIVFPDYYIRDVLADTTNISQYKEEKLLAASTAQTNVPEEEPVKTRPNFMWNRSPAPQSYSENLFPIKGDEEKIRFNWNINNFNDKLQLEVTYILQHVYAEENQTARSGRTENTYVKEIFVEEVPSAESTCKTVDASFDSLYQYLTIKCGGTKYKTELTTNPKKVKGSCSSCKLTKRL